MIVEQRDEPSNFIEGQMSAFEFLLSGKDGGLRLRYRATAARSIPCWIVWITNGGSSNSGIMEPRDQHYCCTRLGEKMRG
jgi:hypothetical protein